MNKLPVYIRYAILFVVLLYVTYTGYMHQIYQVIYPSVDALCPFGGIESLYSILFEGKFLHRVYSSSLVLLIVTVIMVMTSGRSFCGWICPLGTLQGLVTGVSGKIRGKKRLVYYKKDKYFRFLRYVILFFFSIGAWYGGKLLIRPYEPWVAWMHLAEFGHALEEFPIGMALLLGLLLGSLVISRPFCRYLCPMGGFLGLLNMVSPFSIKRNRTACTNCSICDKACPVDIKVSLEETINKNECISCGDCVSLCPSKGALTFQSLKMNYVSQSILGILVVTIFFGFVYTARVSGYYSDTPPGIDELKAAGDMTPEHLKGYMTLSDVAFLFDLDLTKLYDLLGLSSLTVPADTKCRDIADIIHRDFDTDIVRISVGALLNISEDQIKKSCSPGETGASGGFIYGTMTLRQVSESNRISLEQLYQALKLDQREISPDTQCRELKRLVSPDFHTSKVRDAVNMILKN